VKIKIVTKEAPKEIEYRNLVQGRVYRSNASGHIYLCLGQQTGMFHLSSNVLRVELSFGQTVRFTELDAELVIK
jgi:hypothetical protein